jgi:hypothetical protein
MNSLPQLWKALALAGLLSIGISGQDVWNSQALVKPDQVAKQVRDSSPDKPLVLFVGFPVLYRAAHIPDAVLAGPASTPDGLAKLKNAASTLPRNRKLIVYCGCCPFVKCPNVKPAYRVLREMGFSQIQVLELDQNFHTDWVMKGYPVKKPS